MYVCIEVIMWCHVQLSQRGRGLFIAYWVNYTKLEIKLVIHYHYHLSCLYLYIWLLYFIRLKVQGRYNINCQLYEKRIFKELWNCEQDLILKIRIFCGAPCVLHQISAHRRLSRRYTQRQTIIISNQIFHFVNLKQKQIMQFTCDSINFVVLCFQWSFQFRNWFIPGCCLHHSFRSTALLRR